MVSKNASSTTPAHRYLDSNLNRPQLCVRLVAYMSSRIAVQHGRWAPTLWRHTPAGLQGATARLARAGRDVVWTRVGARGCQDMYFGAK